MNKSEQDYQAVKMMLSKVISLTPGYDNLMFILFLLYKRPTIEYEYLEYMLGNEANIVKRLKFLGIDMDEEENVVRMFVNGTGWILVDTFYNFIKIINKIKWPQSMEKIVCMPYALPAVILTYAMLEATKDLFLNIKDERLSTQITTKITETIEKAINEQKFTFKLEEILKEEIKILEKTIGKENIDIIFENLSNFILINYIKESRILIFDAELINGLKLAKEKCTPSLEDISIGGLKKWLSKVQQPPV